MTRAEHMAWCKTRALEYCDRGDPANAFASFASDIRKHPDTANLEGFMTVGFLHVGDAGAMRRFIEGFA